jgi:hypothetical protein
MSVKARTTQVPTEGEGFDILRGPETNRTMSFDTYGPVQGFANDCTCPRGKSRKKPAMIAQKIPKWAFGERCRDTGVIAGGGNHSGTFPEGCTTLNTQSEQIIPKCQLNDEPDSNQVQSSQSSASQTSSRIAKPKSITTRVPSALRTILLHFKSWWCMPMP